MCEVGFVTGVATGGEPFSHTLLFRGEPSSQVLGSSGGAAAAAAAAAAGAAAAASNDDRPDVPLATDLGPETVRCSCWFSAELAAVGQTRRLMSLRMNCSRLLAAGTAFAEEGRVGRVCCTPGAVPNESQEGGRLLPWMTGGPAAALMLVFVVAVAADQYWVGGVPSQEEWWGPVGCGWW